MAAARTTETLRLTRPRSGSDLDRVRDPESTPAHLRPVFAEAEIYRRFGSEVRPLIKHLLHSPEMVKLMERRQAGEAIDIVAPGRSKEQDGTTRESYGGGGNYFWVDRDTNSEPPLVLAEWVRTPKGTTRVFHVDSENPLQVIHLDVSETEINLTDRTVLHQVDGRREQVHGAGIKKVEAREPEVANVVTEVVVAEPESPVVIDARVRVERMSGENGEKGVYAHSNGGELSIWMPGKGKQFPGVSFTEEGFSLTDLGNNLEQGTFRTSAKLEMPGGANYIASFRDAETGRAGDVDVTKGHLGTGVVLSGASMKVTEADTLYIGGGKDIATLTINKGEPGKQQIKQATVYGKTNIVLPDGITDPTEIIGKIEVFGEGNTITINGKKRSIDRETQLATDPPTKRVNYDGGISVVIDSKTTLYPTVQAEGSRYSVHGAMKRLDVRNDVVDAKKATIATAHAYAGGALRVADVETAIVQSGAGLFAESAMVLRLQGLVSRSANLENGPAEAFIGKFHPNAIVIVEGTRNRLSGQITKNAIEPGVYKVEGSKLVPFTEKEGNIIKQDPLRYVKNASVVEDLMEASVRAGIRAEADRAFETMVEKLQKERLSEEARRAAKIRREVSPIITTGAGIRLPDNFTDEVDVTKGTRTMNMAEIGEGGRSLKSVIIPDGLTFKTPGRIIIDSALVNPGGTLLTGEVGNATVEGERTKQKQWKRGRLEADIAASLDLLVGADAVIGKLTNNATVDGNSSLTVGSIEKGAVVTAQGNESSGNYAYVKVDKNNGLVVLAGNTLATFTAPGTFAVFGNHNIIQGIEHPLEDGLYERNEVGLVHRLGDVPEQDLPKKSEQNGAAPGDMGDPAARHELLVGLGEGLRTLVDRRNAQDVDERDREAAAAEAAGDATVQRTGTIWGPHAPIDMLLASGASRLEVGDRDLARIAAGLWEPGMPITVGLEGLSAPDRIAAMNERAQLAAAELGETLPAGFGRTGGDAAESGATVVFSSPLVETATRVLDETVHLETLLDSPSGVPAGLVAANGHRVAEEPVIESPTRVYSEAERTLRIDVLDELLAGLGEWNPTEDTMYGGITDEIIDQRIRAKGIYYRAMTTAHVSKDQTVKAAFEELDARYREEAAQRRAATTVSESA